MEIEKVIKRANSILQELEFEPITDESYNLRDVLEKMSAWLDWYHEDEWMDDIARCSETKKRWKSDTGKIKRFIKRYRDEALLIEPTRKWSYSSLKKW